MKIPISPFLGKCYMSWSVAARCCTLRLSDIWVSFIRCILSLNSVYKGIKLYLQEVPDISIAVCNPLWFTMLSLHRYFEIKFEGDSGEEVALWRLYLFSRWLVAKFKSPCKSFEVLPYVTHIFLPCVICVFFYRQVHWQRMDWWWNVWYLWKTKSKCSICGRQKVSVVSVEDKK